ncbi:hypothetical protein PIB30_028054, partial [Stylosanthes scabra]|nr:hypothetical protein [Stylosanthes scabra]
YHLRDDVDKEKRIEESMGYSLIFPHQLDISSTTSRPKRQRDLPHGDDHSDHPRPRSCV